MKHTSLLPVIFNYKMIEIIKIKNLLIISLAY